MWICLALVTPWKSRCAKLSSGTKRDDHRRVLKSDSDDTLQKPSSRHKKELLTSSGSEDHPQELEKTTDGNKELEAHPKDHKDSSSSPVLKELSASSDQD